MAEEVKSVQARVERPGEVQGFFAEILTWPRVADEAPPWGSYARAGYLDEFWRSSRILSGVIYTMVSRIGSLGWSIVGPVRGLHYWQALLLESDSGWSDLIRLLAQDYLCTDQGAVIEIGREWYPSGEVQALWHMDARRVIPGPVKVHLSGGKEVLADLVFNDVDGYKALKEGQFHRFCSLPSTDQRRRRLGFCFLSRALRAARLARALTEYQEEELADMPPEGIVTVTGLTEAQVRKAILQHKAQQQSRGQLTFPGILWMVGNSLGQPVEVEFKSFRRLWEKFDERAVWEVYLKTLALDAGLDVAELWQIEAAGATKAQISIQHRKAMGKGPAEFLVDLERLINRKILPWGYQFAFDQRDDEQDMLVEQIRNLRIRNIRELWRSDPMTGEGLITREQALELLAEEGVIPARFVLPPEARITDITKELSGRDIATLHSDGTLERHRDYWILNSGKISCLRPVELAQHGGAGSGHWGHEGREGEVGGSRPGTTIKGVSPRVWERAGRRSRFRYIRQALKILAERPVLPTEKDANWHLILEMEGRRRGILAGRDGRAVTVLAPWAKPDEDSYEVVIR